MIAMIARNRWYLGLVLGIGLVFADATLLQAATAPELDAVAQSQAHQAPFTPPASEGDDDPPVDPPVVPEIVPGSPLEDLLTVVEPGQALDRSSLLPLGDTYDPVTGQVSFTTADINLPGNNALVVALRRWVPLDDFALGGPSNGASDETGWAWDIPFIRGNYLVARGPDPDPNDGLGWVFGDNTWHDGYNCTGGAAIAIHDNTDYFYPATYWQGKLLHIPGVTSETFLTTDAGQQITKSNFRIVDCISNPFNDGEIGSGGQTIAHEGIVVAGPNGLTFTFNHIKSYYNGRVTRLSPFVYTRLLMATRVEDRFGNYVEYIYDSDGDEDTDNDGNDADDGDLVRIEASDGRVIEIAYETVAGIKRPFAAIAYPGTASERIWQYDYPGNGVLTVTLPDETSQWRYEGMAAIRFDAKRSTDYTQRLQTSPGKPQQIPGCGTGDDASYVVKVASPGGLQTT